MASNADRRADALVAALAAAGNAIELAKVRKRLAADEAAFGVRMGTLFALAKEHTALAITDVDRLLDHPAYEPRMAAMCILDFKARARLDDAARRVLFERYLGRHDRITTWDMVDRAAPRVVGGFLLGGSHDELHALAAATEPLRRRTAITAPLFFVMRRDPDGIATGFAIAARLAADAHPTVHNAVGIFLKHAGTHDEDALRAFLDVHASTMSRAAVRLAVEKLAPADRYRYAANAPKR